MQFTFSRLPEEGEVESGFVILTDHEVISTERLRRDHENWPTFCANHGGAYCPASNEPIALGWAPIPKGPRSPSASISDLAAFAFEVVSAKNTDKLTLKSVKKLMEKYAVDQASEECGAAYNESCPPEDEIYHDRDNDEELLLDAFRRITTDCTWESC